MSHPTPEETRLEEYRQASNFRTVARVDPSVQEIIQTSTYSTMYLFDEVRDGWEKQKQEGPLFIVKRDKTPMYGLFMLNRQAIKNVFVPLIPGEMKLTITDEKTLHVARRGEKTRRGIWFSEGKEGVDRFREAILGICGEPSKKATPALTHATPTLNSAAAAPGPTADDGLSRLFAGLLQPPPAIPNHVTTTTTTITSTQTTSPAINSIYDPSNPSVASPISTITSIETTGPQLAILPPIMSSQSAITHHNSQSIPPSTFTPLHPPGQTVGDLLNSIMGSNSIPTAAAPMPSQAADSLLNPPSSLASQPPPTAASQSSEAPLPDIPNPTNSEMPQNNATWPLAPNAGQARTDDFLPPLPGPSKYSSPPTRPPMPNMTSPLPAPQFPSQLPGPQQPSIPMPMPGPGPMPMPPHPQYLPIDPRATVASAILDTFPQRNYATPGQGQGQGNVDPKFLFVRDLIDLLHTDSGEPIKLEEGVRRDKAQKGHKGA